MNYNSKFLSTIKKDLKKKETYKNKKGTRRLKKKNVKKKKIFRAGAGAGAGSQNINNNIIILNRSSKELEIEGMNRKMKKNFMICLGNEEKSRILFKNNLYYQDVELNSGAYGNVYLFKTTTEDKLAVKYFKDDDEGKEFKKEKYLLKTIGSLDKDTKKKVIDSYYSTVCRVIIMDYQHGDLNKVIPSINLQEKVGLFNQVLNAIKQLLNKDLFYCDLKLENILYKRGSEGIKTCLGDVGSIILGQPFFEDSSKWISVQEFNDSFNNQTYVFTFPYLDYKGTIIKGKITKSFILSFYQQILIFFILLTGLYSTWTPFWFETIKEGRAPIHLKTELETNDTQNLLERNDVSSISILDEYFYPDKDVFLERFVKDSEGNSYNLFNEGHYNYGEIKERILSDLESMHEHFSSAYRRLP